MMPQYRMVARISGSHDGQDWPAPGGVVDLPEDEGRHLEAQGFIVPVEAAITPKVETATVNTKPRARRPRG